MSKPPSFYLKDKAVDFTELLEAVQKTDKANPMAYRRILSFDPGHTTGWTCFDHGEPIRSGQIDTTSISACLESAQPLFHTYHPEVVVMEDYRIYKWRQKQHVGSDMLTTRIIGSLETLAIQDFVNYVVKQPAHVAKGFCTDQKLNEWGFWRPGERHARDAIRHACYYILFGGVRKVDKHKPRSVG